MKTIAVADHQSPASSPLSENNWDDDSVDVIAAVVLLCSTCSVDRPQQVAVCGQCLAYFSGLAFRFDFADRFV